MLFVTSRACDRGEESIDSFPTFWIAMRPSSPFLRPRFSWELSPAPPIIELMSESLYEISLLLLLATGTIGALLTILPDILALYNVFHRS